MIFNIKEFHHTGTLYRQALNKHPGTVMSEIQWDTYNGNDGICGKLYQDKYHAHCWVGKSGSFSIIIHGTTIKNSLRVRGESANQKTGQYYCQAILNAHAQATTE
jgi:hypothetical protein